MSEQRWVWMRGAILGAGLVVLLVASASCGGGTAAGPPASPTFSTVVAALQTELDAITPATTPQNFGTAVVQVASVQSRGKILTDDTGMTLYVLKDDVPASGVSHCDDACATTWPPLVINYGFTPQTPGLGPLGSMLRTDGARQVMYRGRPLYLYTGDKKPGDTNGDGIDGRWSVATP